MYQCNDLQHIEFENVSMQHIIPSSLPTPPALDINAALARKVITQHGYLTGLTVAQIIDIDDKVFSL